MSSSTTDFKFNNLAGTRSDFVDQSERSLQNTRFSNYMLSNYGADTIRPDQSITFASSQPNLLVSGSSHGQGIDGNIIDIDSLLSVSKEQARALEKLQLQQRPFATVPYLGRGPFDPMAESKLQQTDTFSNNKKSVNTLSEVSFIPMSNYPLIPSIQKTITNPTYLVEGFVRGGEGTRK